MALEAKVIAGRNANKAASAILFSPVLLCVIVAHWVSFTKEPGTLWNRSNQVSARIINACRGVMQSIPTSVVLEGLVQRTPHDQLTLAWLLDHLQSRSFGIVLLLLGIVALLPVVSPAAGILLSIPAYQMIRAHRAPVFPGAFAQRSLPADRFARMVMRVTPTLRFLERFVRPRWPMPFEPTKRVVGIVVMMLGAGLFAPIPLSNVPVGLTIILIAFAYLEDDGILLAGALTIALAMLALGALALWSSVAATLSLMR